MATNYKNLLNDTYITKQAKDIVLNALNGDVPTDFDVNYSFYYLRNNALVNSNNECKYKFKTKKEFKELIKKVILINTLNQIKYTCDNITIFKVFHKYDINGNGLYNIKILANNIGHKNMITNISSNIAYIMACLDTNLTKIDNNAIIHAYDTDDLFIKDTLQKHGINSMISGQLI